MKNIKIIYKLLAGNVLQLLFIGLLVTVLFYLSNRLENISSVIVKTTEQSEATKALTLHIKDFIDDKISYEEFKKISSGMNLELDESDQKIFTNTEKIAALKTANLDIENQIMEITDNSILQSNTYIKIMSKKLADSEMRNEVTVLERLVIGGAIVNTSNNFIMQVLFLQMKEDINARDTLISTLAEFNVQTEKDVEALKNTPYAQMAITASEGNQKTLELVNQFIKNQDELIRLDEEIYQITDNLYQEMSKETIDTLNSGFGSIKSLMTKFFIVLLVVSLIIIILNLTLSRLITFVFKNLNIDLAKITEGDLTFTPPLEFLDRKDEIGDLTRSVDKLLKTLKEIIGNIRNGAGSIASASKQISSSSQQLSQGANEQAASVEEVSSTMEEISTNIEQNTVNAKSTEEISKNAQEGIKDVADLASKTLDATKEIADKIEIINDIAFQTNILALNAAVEAARAGEQGKGFAVVASEVRKLAERSKTAAEDIVRLTTDSYALAEKAEERMKKTLPEVDKTSNLVQEISAAGLEQNNGVNQVNTAIQQLNNVTQQNASSSEELATSSEQLASQAESLNDLVAFFRINESEARGVLKERKSVKEIEPEKESIKKQKSKSIKERIKEYF